MKESRRDPVGEGTKLVKESRHKTRPEEARAICDLDGKLLMSGDAWYHDVETAMVATLKTPKVQDSRLLSRLKTEWTFNLVINFALLRLLKWGSVTLKD